MNNPENHEDFVGPRRQDPFDMDPDDLYNYDPYWHDSLHQVETETIPREAADMQSHTFLDDIGPNDPPATLYSELEIVYHEQVYEHIVSEVLSCTFSHFTCIVSNYEFAFDIAATGKKGFHLKVRCGDRKAEYETGDMDLVIDKAFAAYRLFVCTGRELNNGPEPDLSFQFLRDETGKTVPFNAEARAKLAQLEKVPSSLQNIDGKYVSATIVPVVDGSFLVLVTHHVNEIRVMANMLLCDYHQARRFVTYYLDRHDKMLFPSHPNVVLQAALAILKN